MSILSSTIAKFKIGITPLYSSTILTCLFLTAIAIGAIHHEFWRDEMEAWLVAKEPANLAEVLEEVHYQGAPLLWPLLLRPLTLITHNPAAMQVLTWMIAGGTVFIILYFAPFTRVQKALLPFSYYLLFEYGIVCRNYLPGIFFLAVACVLYPAARLRPWPFAFSLALASMASAHSLIVALALAASFWGPACLRLLGFPTKNTLRAEPFHLLPLLGVIAGVCIAAYSMSPRADTFYAPASGWSFDWNGDRAAKLSWAFVCSHFPWPRPDGFFWIPSWHTPFPSFDPNLAFALAIGLWGISLLFLNQSKPAFLFYTMASLGVGLFLYSKYLGFYRHTGFLFFIFLFAVWIKKTHQTSSNNAYSRWLSRSGDILLTLMLCNQAITGIWALRRDIDQPFSGGRMAAKIIRDTHHENSFIAVGPDWAGAPLAGYLNRTLFYPQERKYGTFTRWDLSREDDLNDFEFLMRTLKEANGKEVILSLDHSLPSGFMVENDILPLGFSGGSLTPFEDYYLYKVVNKRSGPNNSDRERGLP